MLQDHQAGLQLDGLYVWALGALKIPQRAPVEQIKACSRFCQHTPAIRLPCFHFQPPRSSVSSPSLCEEHKGQPFVNEGHVSADFLHVSTCVWAPKELPYDFRVVFFFFLPCTRYLFVSRELVVGPEAKPKIEIICSLRFPLTDTNWKQTISKCRPHSPHHSARGISLFSWGGGVGKPGRTV